jgi:hypothetical protein
MEKRADKDRKQILLRLSPTLWKELAAWAEDDFRSINGQIEYLLTECVKRRRNRRIEVDNSKSDREE